MSNRVLLKKSSVSAKAPLSTDLEYGEVALNYQDGKLYFKTAGNNVEHFDSRTIVAQKKQEYTATASQTTFTVTGGYVLTTVQVFANGIALAYSDYTATNGTTVVLTDPRVAGDNIIIWFGGPASGGANGSFTQIDRKSYIATSGQTTFNVTYAGAYVDVYINGSHLNLLDYTATSGTNIVLNSGATVNDEIDLVGYYGTVVSSSVINNGDVLIYNGTTKIWDSLAPSAITTASAAKWSTARTLSYTGDATGSMSVDGSTNVSAALTLATVNSNVGSFGSTTASPIITVNAKGLVTAVSTSTITPAIGSITGLGTNVATALGVNTGTAGAFVVNGDALGTPASGVMTNVTGTAAGLTAGNVTTNANLTGVITSTGNATAIADAALSIAKTSGLQAAIDLKQNLSSKDAANGYAGLDSSSKINPSQLPALAITDTFVVASQAAQIALTAEVGDVAIRTDLSKSFILQTSPSSTFANWQELLTPTDSVSSVFGRTGVVTAQNGDYTAAQVGAPAGSGNSTGTNTGDQTNISGNAATVTTNANLTGAVTSTGNATLLGSFSSANLAGALTDKTGSGSAVFATSPTLITPALGSPSSVGTMPAFTLGGTVSGGGNNINNVVIGASSPLAGSFTTVTASGAITATGAITQSTFGQLTNDGGSDFRVDSISGKTLSLRSIAADMNISADPGVAGSKTVSIKTSGVTPAVFSITGLAVTGTLSATGAGSIQGLTVGRGAGAVATNTAVGASALAVNSSGAYNTVVGYEAGTANTTGNQNTFVGRIAGASNTIGSYNSAFGDACLNSNSTGANNTSVGYGALQLNTTASENTAVGYQAAYSNTTGTKLVAVGHFALTSSVTGTSNVAVGWGAAQLTTGSNNTTVGDQSLRFNTSGQYNTAVGSAALNANTTASNNTAVGYQAGYSNTTGLQNVAIGAEALKANTTANSSVAVGYQAAYANTTGTEHTAIGAFALYGNTTGTRNTSVGYASSQTNTTGDNNAVLGRAALLSNTTGSYNVVIGNDALRSNTTASNNTAVGYQSLYLNQTGANNVAIGQGSLYNNTGSDNTAVGAFNTLGNNTSGTQNSAFSRGALGSNTTGSYNSAFGYQALQANTTASNNTAVGYQAGFSNTTGAQNTAVGYQALNANVTGNYNAAFGDRALRLATGSNNASFGGLSSYSNTTGSFNTAIGNEALYNNTTASNNTAVGYGAAYSNTTGTLNTALGQSSLYSNITGGSNVAVGLQALFSNTTASSNTAVGYQAAYSNTTGTGLTALGIYALGNNTTANYNTAVGYSASQLNTTGASNASLGTSALYANTTGSFNTAIGRDALSANTTASNNTAVGYQAGYANTTGSRGVFIGLQAGSTVTTGSNNTFVGAGSGTSVTTGVENTALGDDAYANAAVSTGNYNVAVGRSALRSNTTASNNTAVGYQAGYTNTTGVSTTAIGKSALYAQTTATNNTAVGTSAGVAVTTGSQNTLIGVSAGGALTTGSFNTFIGMNSVGNGGSGELITTGSKNTILGGYNGNQGSLDIRTASNYIVLSDGDGNPRVVVNGSGNMGIGTTSPSSNQGLVLQLGTQNLGLNPKLKIAGYHDLGNLYVGQGPNTGEMGFTTNTHGRTGNGDYAPPDNITSSVSSWSVMMSGATLSNNDYFRIRRAPPLSSSITPTFVDLLSISAQGNVGIGTTNPNARLSLIDEDGGQAMLQVRNYNTSATGAFSNVYTAEIRGASSGTQMHGTLIHLHENNNDRRTLDVSDYNGIIASFVNGKVGIGTTSPVAKLDIAVASAAVDGTKGVRITNPVGTIVVLECGVSNDSFVGTTSASLFNIRTNNVTRATFDGSGNLGIGTSSPVSRIDALSVGNTTAGSKSFQLVGGSDLGNAASMQYGLWVSQAGARYTSQTAIYAVAGENTTGFSGLYGSTYYGVNGVISISSQATQQGSGVYGVCNIPNFNYNHLNAGVQGLATGGSTTFSNEYGFSSDRGAFGGHFVSHGKASSIGVYADAYLDASPGAGTVAIPLVVATNGTQLLRVNPGGSIALMGAINTATGTGITFPATQSASTDANTLDDYEEGTWTPTVANFTVSGTSTLSGTYTKIGRVVYFNLSFANTGTIAFSTSALITLPFTGIDSSGMIAMSLYSNSESMTSGKNGVQFVIDAINSRFFVGVFTTTSAGQTLQFGGFYRVS